MVDAVYGGRIMERCQVVIQYRAKRMHSSERRVGECPEAGDGTGDCSSTKASRWTRWEVTGFYPESSEVVPMTDKPSRLHVQPSPVRWNLGSGSG